MALFSLRMPPGMLKNGTTLQAVGRWAEGTLMRWAEGTMRPLGGWQELTASAMGAAVEYSDSFTDVNGTDLVVHTPTGSPEDFDWIDSTLNTTGCEIQSNSAVLIDGAGLRVGSHVTDTDVSFADYTVSCGVTFPSGAGYDGSVFLMARWSAVASTGYMVKFEISTGSLPNTTLTLSRWTAGTETIMDSATVPTMAENTEYVLYLTVNGTAISAGLDGVEYVAATNATHTVAARAGLYIAGFPTDGGAHLSPLMDDFTVTLGDRSDINLDGVPRAILGWRGNDGSSSIGIGTNTKLYAHWLGTLYDITPSGFTAGTEDAALGSGDYGDGLYSAGFYGAGDPAQTTMEPPAVWHLDNWGDYLVGCCSPNDGKLYYWDRNAANIAVLVDASAPTGNTGLVVTPERYLVALGASSGARTVQWSAQEDFTNWSELSTEATTTLTSTGVAPSNGDTVTIGSKTYTFKTVITAADGDVLIGTAATSLSHLKEAVNLTGSPGTNYATATTANTLVTAGVLTATTLAFTAIAAGTAGNLIPSTEVAVTLSFPGLVLSGGTDDGGAGSFVLEGKGALVAGRRAKSETLLWTTDDLHAMRYIGGTLVYAFERVGGSCGLIAPGAIAQPGILTFWMSQRSFWVYDGFVKEVESEVGDYVFSDFNRTQSGKVTAYTRAQFGEVTWHYPSSGSNENDRYVTFNYREKHWTTGELERTAGCDAGALDYPVCGASNGKLYEHERGWSHLDTDGTPLIPTASAGPVQIGDGEDVLSVSQIIPDEKNPVGILGVNLGNVELSLYTSFYPGEDEVLHGPFSINKLTDARFTGRWVRPVVTEVEEGDWRFGVMRLDGSPAGKR